MATSTSGAQRPATTKRRTTKAKPATAGSRSTRTAASARRTTRATTSTQPKTRVEHAQVIAERAVLVPIGASLLARDNLVSTVKGFTTKYRTRTNFERELKRYERRGVTARNRFERQVRRARTHVEREVRQRRSLVEKTMRQNRRRLDRELISVRRDFEKQSGAVSARVERLVANAQGLIGS
ncbi:MAG TPA: hypothetical protein VGF91_13625 [Solirubrobacteraceae bacterium]|jgi:hypothetical protein